MNVDWDWIKQRPHFLAEELSRDNKVLVLYPFSWRRSRLSSNSRNLVNLVALIRFPLGSKLIYIKILNKWFWKFYIGFLLKWNQYDFIWVSSPDLFELSPYKFNCKIIYDCMDDNLEFIPNFGERKELLSAEIKLIKASDHIFCSSSNLYDKIIVRGGDPTKCTIVLNAFEERAFTHGNISKIKFSEKDFFSIGYIGTVSSWFDFNSIIDVVEKIPDVIFYIIGPIENLTCDFPKHERIVYLGVIEHNRIQLFANSFDCLIMPFLKIPLIESVDPVKLHEYIFFNKPIISIYYKGLDRFKNFVEFYNNSEELVSKIRHIIKFDYVRKFSEPEREAFLKENSWGNRSKVINSILNTL